MGSTKEFPEYLNMVAIVKIIHANLSHDKSETRR